MELNSNHNASALTNSASMNKSRLGLHSALLPYSPPGAVSSSKLLLRVPSKKTGLLDNVRSGFLDAMKSSSPTDNRLTKGSDMEPMDKDIAYCNWMLNYPSALASFEKITNLAKGKKVVLFLDYDGTLSPIVDNPDQAFMSNHMHMAVKNVAKYFPIAIISGRSCDKVLEFVGLTELYYAGSHGMDIVAPVLPNTNGHTNGIMSTNKQGNKVNLIQPASEFLPMINEVLTSLVELTKEIKGAKVENNKFCVSVHYRNVDEKNWTTIAECVQDIVKNYPRLRLTHGRKVLEVRPMLDWDKGKAVEFLLESLDSDGIEVHGELRRIRPSLSQNYTESNEILQIYDGFVNCDNVLPIHVGDDRTDEDAFKFLREGNRGYGILVSPTPKESDAFFSLRDTSEVMEFLKSLAVWKESSAQR